MTALVADIQMEAATIRMLSIFRQAKHSFLPRPLQRRLEYLRERVQLKKQLAECATAHGTVFVHNWGRDCDGVTHSSLHEFPADITDYESEIGSILEWAEGPEHFRILTPDQAARFEPEPSRDLHAEAHEDGRCHFITL